MVRGEYCGPQMSPIAFFSAEYGLHHSLPFYAGVSVFSQEIF